MIEENTVWFLLLAIWSGWQEIRMWKMCLSCPFYRAAQEKKRFTDAEESRAESPPSRSP
jgi:hypothetical protein